LLGQTLDSRRAPADRLLQT